MTTNENEGGHGARLAAKLATARATLLDFMTHRGLREIGGWGLGETTRLTDSGREILLRPVHPSHAAPADLECAVLVDEGGAARHECRCAMPQPTAYWRAG